MNVHRLDAVVLNEDMPAQGLRQGDLGTVVEIYAPKDLEVEFVKASGRTQALVTLQLTAVREVDDDDLVAVRPTHDHDS